MRRVVWACAAVLGLAVSFPGAAAAQADWVEEPLPARDTYATLMSAAAGEGGAWAFGTSMESSIARHSLAYQRGPDGWTEVPVPDVGQLYESEFVAGDDVWAVGKALKYGGGRPLHWDGQSWTEIPFATPPDYLFTMGRMTAFASDDVWAVGGGGVNGPDTPSRGIVQHWDGAAWTDVPVPEDVAHRWRLEDVDGVATDDMWAVGHLTDGNGAVALHWDGAAWTQVPMPEIETTDSESLDVSAVEALAPDDVWATGTIRSYDGETAAKSVLLHWNGTEWTLEEGPQDGLHRGELVEGGGQLWSLGERLWHYDGEQWQEAGGPTNGVPSGGATFEDGRLFVVGGAGRYPDQQLPFVAAHR